MCIFRESVRGHTGRDDDEEATHNLRSHELNDVQMKQI